MILRKGSRGQDVKDLQEFLEIGADGIFGSGTEAAVKQWQSLNGLTADGIVGPATWDAMASLRDCLRFFRCDSISIFRPVAEFHLSK